MHKLTDDQLRGIILEETGQGEDSSTISLILGAIKYIKKFANFNVPQTDQPVQMGTGLTPAPIPPAPIPPDPPESIGLNLGYTINLNLPPTSDIAVFNAIFKSLRENLLQK